MSHPDDPSRVVDDYTNDRNTYECARKRLDDWLYDQSAGMYYKVAVSALENINATRKPDEREMISNMMRMKVQTAPEVTYKPAVEPARARAYGDMSDYVSRRHPLPR